MNDDLTPQQIFDQLKAKRETSTHASLKRIYAAALNLGNRYVRTGQTIALKKVLYVMETIEKEKAAVDLGINKFIYRDDIDFFIDSWSHKSNPIKIIELSKFPRDIPEEIASLVEKSKGIFDEFYVLFTDYTGREEKRIEAEKRNTDPVLFGVFIDQGARLCCDRFYYIGDWEDDYCDLTLEKMLSDPEFNAKQPVRYMTTPRNEEELKAYLLQHQEKEDSDGNISFQSLITTVPSPIPEKQGFFAKLLSLFRK